MTHSQSRDSPNEICMLKICIRCFRFPYRRSIHAISYQLQVEIFSHVKFAKRKGSYKAFVEFHTFKCFSVDVNTRKSGFTHAHLCLECLSVDADTRKYGVTHALSCLLVDADTRKSGFTHALSCLFVDADTRNSGFTLALSRLECLSVDAIESKSGLTYVLSCLESKNG